MRAARRFWEGIGAFFIIVNSFLAAQRRVAILFPISEVRVNGNSGHVPIEIDTPAAPAYIRWDRRADEKMTMGTFGENLKREREMRGVSLDEITAATRIATRFLQAIENEQWDQLPGGVFNRGFVRAVARYLGLDEENIVAEYASAVGDRPGVPVWTGSPPTVTRDRSPLAWVLAAVLGLVLAMGVWFGVRRIFVLRALQRTAQVASTSATPSPELPLLPSATEPVPYSAESAPNSPPGPSALPRGADSAADPVSPTAAVPFELKVEADKTTRVVVEADAHRVFEGRMKAGDGRVFTARDKFQVSAGDAGALLLELNGKTLAPIGPPGHEGTATLTRESLKGTAGGGD
jgi:cytoskeleton protein RodZ